MSGKENGYGVSLWTYGGHIRGAVIWRSIFQRSVTLRFAVDLLEARHLG
jgi:hypothetical protein